MKKKPSFDWKDYFTFSPKETRAAIILASIILISILLPYFFQDIAPNTPDKNELEKLKAVIKDSFPKRGDDSESGYENVESKYATAENTPLKGELFTFDPNTLDAKGWERLGLPTKTIRTLMNYRQKGGLFRSPEDLKKIWGMPPELAERLKPYANIHLPQKSMWNNKTPYSNTTTNALNKSPKPIDINTATADDFKSLPGITGGMHYRIVHFRDKLQGFVSVEQLKETYGMTDSIYQAILPYLRIEKPTVKKMNINKASEYEMSQNPYIDKSIARAIVIYRTQHGLYQSVEDIKKIVFIKQEIFEKVAPYLTVE